MRPEWGVAHVLGKDGAPAGTTDGTPAGLAFAVSRRQVLTCAHVVNAALGREPRDPSPPEQSTLSLVFPFADVTRERELSATISAWLPSDSNGFYPNDVALLQLHEDLPPGVPVLRLARSTSGGRVQMVGPHPERRHPIHLAGDLLGAVDRSRYQVDARLRGRLRVAHGFSGGPVWYQGPFWYQRAGRVAGMLQAAGAELGAVDVYVLGVDVLSDAYVPLPPDRRRRLSPDHATWLMAGAFGIAGMALAVTREGWHWLAVVAGAGVAGVVLLAGLADQLARTIARRRASRS